MFNLYIPLSEYLTGERCHCHAKQNSNEYCCSARFCCRGHVKELHASRHSIPDQLKILDPQFSNDLIHRAVEDDHRIHAK